MKKASCLVVGMALLSSCGGSKLDQSIEKGKALVRVGDEKIHEGYLDLLQRVNPGVKAQLDAPMGKKRLVDNLVEQELLYQESVRRGLDKSPGVQEKADLYKRVVIAQSVLDDEVEKKAKKYYDENKEKEFERVKVSHIFFSGTPTMTPPAPGKTPTPPSEEDKKKAQADAEAKAKAAYDRLKKGDAWDVVVTEMSDDKGSAPRGGDMGYLSKGDKRIERMEYQPLVDKAFALKKDEYSEPIAAKDGWHIIKVTEEKQAQPYEEAMMQLKFKLRGEIKNTLMAELKQKNKIQYLDVSLAENPSAQPGALPMPAAQPQLEVKTVESKPAK